jgi:S-adenosylmethionine:tRNA ribosyltransferase-isomerase
MIPGKLLIQDYTYDLPEVRIAAHPLQERDESKLLIYKSGTISEDKYFNLDQYLPQHSLLIFNDTKVVEARLIFKKPTGAQIEIFCLEPHGQYIDITSAMSSKGSVKWNCLIGGASKWKPGQVLEKNIAARNKSVTLQAKYLEKNIDSFTIQLSWIPEELSFAEVLHNAGNIPLPPYIKREVESKDSERYQTIYAEHEGSVAAPTAGLHFTPRIFDRLIQKKIDRDFVTLHVGAGTFKPVKTQTIGEHEMHSEYIDVTLDTIKTLRHSIDRNIFAVGTTSLRTLESLYWLGVKLLDDPVLDLTTVNIEQWYPYEYEKDHPPIDACLEALIKKMDASNLKRIITRTSILIAPGYSIKMVKGLITNFHQPQSTLLLLVAAFIGDDWQKVYGYALQNDFRFLSYGDGCLLFRQ